MTVPPLLVAIARQIWRWQWQRLMDGLAPADSEGNFCRRPSQFAYRPSLFGFLPGRETYVLDKAGTVIEVFNNQFSPAKHVDVAEAALESIVEPMKTPFEFPKFEFPSFGKSDGE